MDSLTYVRHSLLLDARLIRRDAFLSYLIVLPILTALAMRFGWPALVARAQQSDLALDLYLLPATSYAFILGNSLLLGTVVGFILIEDRDEHTLDALMVTPVSMSRYLTYRLGTAAGAVILLTLVTLPLAHIHHLPWPWVVCGALASAPGAAFAALVFVNFAPNKVQGFAVLKGLGAMAMAVAVAGQVTPAPLDNLYGIIFPPYFAYKAMLVPPDEPATMLLYSLVGVVLQSVAAILLARRFGRRALG